MQSDNEPILNLLNTTNTNLLHLLIVALHLCSALWTTGVSDRLSYHFRATGFWRCRRCVIRWAFVVAHSIPRFELECFPTERNTSAWNVLRWRGRPDYFWRSQLRGTGPGIPKRPEVLKWTPFLMELNPRWGASWIFIYHLSSYHLMWKMDKHTDNKREKCFLMK